MKIPTRPRTLGLGFNITPLIDIIFLLVIFFLVASHLVRSEIYEEVDLPEATQTEDEPDEQPHRLVVTITADGQLHVSGKTVSPIDVRQMIHASGAEMPDQPLEVHIRSDRSVPYRIVEPLLLACAEAGVTNVKFPVLNR